jgi:transcriptional regulator with XRE-family HTH domain
MRRPEDARLLAASASEIKARRALIDISQEELAHRADVHRSFVARLELAQTQPSLAVLFRLSAALDSDPADLVRAIAQRFKRQRGVDSSLLPADKSRT